MDSEALVVNRWRRYGKDRLYVETLDGQKLGWWDLTTEEGHPESPEHADALARVRARWTSERPVIDATAKPWIDLAANSPGEAARLQARSAKQAAPFKMLLARAVGVHTKERAWRLGADGEEMVADQLAKVAKADPRWRFLHAVPVGDRGSDIDHVLIGPGGVFTVNTKHHPGANIWVSGDTFMVDGSRQPYVRNSRHESQRAARLLSSACGFDVQVEGLIVTVNAKNVVIKKASRGVTVLYRRALASWLLKHGDVLATEACDAVFEKARRSTTWQG